MILGFLQERKRWREEEQLTLVGGYEVLLETCVYRIDSFAAAQVVYSTQCVLLCAASI
jgi:hypothetical protein